MPHSYNSLITHIVYSRKDRRPLLDEALEPRLFPYFGGILRELKGKLYLANGAMDHVHLLAELPATIALAEVIGKIKGSSTKWIHESFPDRSAFSWQRGYGAFSVSKSQVPGVARYIEGQKEHHRKVSFQEEYVRLLRRHGVSFDEKHLWV